MSDSEPDEASAAHEADVGADSATPSSSRATTGVAWSTALLVQAVPAAFFALWWSLHRPLYSRLKVELRDMCETAVNFWPNPPKNTVMDQRYGDLGVPLYPLESSESRNEWIKNIDKINKVFRETARQVFLVRAFLPPPLPPAGTTRCVRAAQRSVRLASAVTHVLLAARIRRRWTPSTSAWRWRPPAWRAICSSCCHGCLRSWACAASARACNT